MTYSSGGLIQAADFNGFAGAAQTGSAATVNQIWGIGTGDCGYGQSTIVTNVSAGNTVAASDWATLINRLNSIRTHQSGSGSGLSAPSAGSTITYLSTLSSSISTAYSSRTAYASSGSTATTTKTGTINVGAGSAGSTTISWTITWPSVDQARYFFNSGGYYNVAYSSFTNTGGTSRGTSIQTLAQTNFASKYVYVNSMSARQGSGGTVITDTTGTGYYQLTTGNTTYCQINSTSYYTGDYIQMNVYQSGGAGSYSANGNVHYVQFIAYSSTTGSTQPADSINITLGMNLNLIQPETTNLSNSWGTVSVA